MLKNEQLKLTNGIIMLRRLTIKIIESTKIRLFKDKKMVKTKQKMDSQN